MSRIGNIIKMNDFIFSFLPDGIKAKKCRTDMNNYIQDVKNLFFLFLLLLIHFVSDYRKEKINWY